MAVTGRAASCVALTARRSGRLLALVPVLAGRAGLAPGRAGGAGRRRRGLTSRWPARRGRLTVAARAGAARCGSANRPRPRWCWPTADGAGCAAGPARRLAAVGRCPGRPAPARPAARGSAAGWSPRCARPGAATGCAERVTVRSVGPLGLAARQVSLPAPGRLRVLPPFTSRKHLPSKLARLRELDGRTALRVRGQGTEFDSLRDYVVGDDVRSIDWRASARRQQVVVRTWRPERDRRVLLRARHLAHLGGPGRRRPAPGRRDGRRPAAGRAGRPGRRPGRPARHGPPGAGPGGRVLRAPSCCRPWSTAMAPLEPDLVEADWTSIVATIRQRVTQRALVVLLTPLEPAAVEEGLLPVVHRLTSHHR